MIQGSKLSSLLYSIYVNEAPEVKEIMKDEEMTKKIIKNKEVKEFDATHETYSYVDDSYNCISVKNPEDLDEYVNDFFQILVEYHTANKLKLNQDKTSLLTKSSQKC